MLSTIKKLVAENDFSPVELLRLMAATERYELGKKTHKIWMFLNSLIKWDSYTDAQLIDIGVESNTYSGIRLAAHHLSMLDMTNDERIRLGKKADDRSVWSKVAETLDLEGLTNLQLVKLARRVGEQQAWPRVANALALEGLSNKNLLKIAKVANNNQVTEVISARLQLQGLNDDELLEIGKGFHFHCISETFWEPVLDSIFSTRNEIKRLIEFGNRANNSEVWSLILKRKGSRLGIARLLEIGRAADDQFIWAEIGKFINLKKATLAQLMEVGVGSSGYNDTWKRFMREFETRNLSNSEIIGIANEADDFNVDDWARERIKTKKLSKTEIAELGKSSRDWQVWDKLLPQLA